MESILSKIKPSDVRADPFPHIIARDVLEPGLCDRLLAEMPAVQTITQGRPYVSNQRFSYSASDAVGENKVSPLWREFVQAHVGQEFLNQFINLFGGYILKTFPSFEGTTGGLNRLRAGVRKVDDFGKADVVLDCQICVNTPVSGKPTSVKIAHLDSPDELFAGLLYLRSPGDDSRGGDLELYRYKTKNPKFHGPRLVDKRYVEKVAAVPYERNVLVLFLNSFEALHGVTRRTVTGHPRYLVNFLGEVKKPLFDLKPYKENMFQKMLRHLPH